MGENFERRRGSIAGWTVAVVAMLATGCAATRDGDARQSVGAEGMEQVPAEIVGEPIRRVYDGTTDDLLTAGLGAAGLRGAAPGFADPLRPTPTELRRRVIYNAYRGLVDVTDAGGFGRLYGPAGEARVPGVEYLLAVRTPEGESTTSVLLQIPAHFDPKNPCLLAVASSGSRGIYGALPTAAEWGLKRGCAVVHTDKGTGMGVWDVDRGRGYRIDGSTTDDPSDPLITFAPPVLDGLADVKSDAPHSMLFKHAHSGLNPEADWGVYLLQAIRVAIELLNAETGLRGKHRLTPQNTLILAAGISNGGAAVLRAVEADRAGWIDGALASEPNAIVHGRTQGLSIRSGGRLLTETGIALYDYTGLHYLYQPCAVLAETDPTAGFHAATAASRAKLEQWCRDLQAAEMLPAGDVAAAARAAREHLANAGIVPEGLRIGHLNVAATLWPAIVTTYAWAYSRLPYWEPPCGVSFAPVDANGRPRALTDEESARLWADGTGVAPTGGIAIVARGADGERRLANEGSLRLALCYAPDRVLTDAARRHIDAPEARAELLERVKEGQDEVVMSAHVGNRPVIVVHGRADSLIPVNHSSRAYYAVNQRDRGERDELRYYELEHGQHFDGFLPLPGFAESHVPMQPWMLRGLDALHARLTAGTPLPPSQVIRSRPRGGAPGKAPALEEQHLGTLRANPGADAITFEDGVLDVPQ